MYTNKVNHEKVVQSIQATLRYLCQFILGLLQLRLFLGELRLRRLQALTLGLDDAIDAAVHLHGAHPHAERLRGGRHAADDLRVEVGLGTVLADLLQHAVADVVLVEVHQLLDEVLVTCAKPTQYRHSHWLSNKYTTL